MAMEWKREGERLVVLRVQGRMTYADWCRMNAGDGQEPPADGKMLALVILDQFEGWDQDERWGDLSWVEQNDARLDKVAVVGDEKWRSEMEVFLLKDLRPVKIRYFNQNEQDLARVWLETG